MATFAVRSDLKTCPYNSAHKVKTSRFHQHLAGCAKQYPHLRLRQCPFNAMHRISDADWDQHLIQCPDSLQKIKSIFDEPALKATTIKSKVEAKADEEDDPWAEQYFDHNIHSTYDMLGQEVTADWLFDKRFNGEGNTNFTDTIYIQKMSWDERKKYQRMCVKKIKDDIDNGVKDEGSAHKLEKNEHKEWEANTIKKQKVVVTANASLRKPTTTNPFDRNPSRSEANDGLRMKGIGRGRGQKPVVHLNE